MHGWFYNSVRALAVLGALVYVGMHVLTNRQQDSDWCVQRANFVVGADPIPAYMLDRYLRHPDCEAFREKNEEAWEARGVERPPTTADPGWEDPGWRTSGSLDTGLVVTATHGPRDGLSLTLGVV